MSRSIIMLVLLSATLSACTHETITDQLYLHIAIDGHLQRERVIIGLYGGDEAAARVRRFIERVESVDHFDGLRGTRISRIPFHPIVVGGGKLSVEEADEYAIAVEMKDVLAKSENKSNHYRAGLVSVPNMSPDSRRFLVTLRAAPQLNGRSTVIGRVLRGLHVLRKSELAEWTYVIRHTNNRERAIIVDCGLLPVEQHVGPEADA